MAAAKLQHDLGVQANKQPIAQWCPSAGGTGAGAIANGRAAPACVASAISSSPPSSVPSTTTTSNNNSLTAVLLLVQDLDEGALGKVQAAIQEILAHRAAASSSSS